MATTEKPTPIVLETKKSKMKLLRNYFPLLLILLVIALSLTSVYFYKKSTNNPTQASQTEIKSLVQKVGKLAVIPTDETPTLATVSDPSALKGQAFFVDAIEGDKVLIYTNAKKAVLYRPSVNRVINIAPLNLGDTQTPSSAQ